MCFALQQRAIFRHLNFKKRSDAAVLCTFSLQNALFATVACNFWFPLWPLASSPADLTGLLFDWPDTRIIEKTQHFETSLTFGASVSSFFWLSRYCIFFLLTLLHLIICFSSAFSTLHIVGSLLFKFPSMSITRFFCFLGAIEKGCSFETAVWLSWFSSISRKKKFYPPNKTTTCWVLFYTEQGASKINLAPHSQPLTKLA